MAKYLPDEMSMAVLFGGSFDPVHYGHIQAAEEARQQLGVDRVWLLPCHIPPHKAALQATPQQRAEMLALALQNYPGLAVDTWELEQSEPSYTRQTLIRYRQLYGDTASLVFLMGWDSLQNLSTWHRWQELEALTNFAVWQRPGYNDLPEDITSWLRERQVSPSQLKYSRAGAVALLKTTPVDISSTVLRQSGSTAHIPPAVQDYITTHRLYAGSRR